MQRGITTQEYFKAAHEGDLAALNQYLKENKDNLAAINVIGSDGCTALMTAANNNQIDFVMTLLAVPGIEVNTPLMFLALYRHLKSSIQERPTQTPKLATVTPEGFIDAIEKGNLSTVQQYIKENENNVEKALNCTDKRGVSPLMLAMQGSYDGYSKKRDTVGALLAVPGIDIFVINIYDRHLFSDGPYLNDLLEVAVKRLVNLDGKQVTENLLKALHSQKGGLLNAIMKLPKQQAFDALKEIVIKKETSALGRLFGHGKKTFYKGMMVKVVDQYIKLAKELNETIDPAIQQLAEKKTFNFGGLLGVFSTGTRSAQSELETDDEVDSNQEIKPL